MASVSNILQKISVINDVAHKMDPKEENIHQLRNSCLRLITNLETFEKFPTMSRASMTEICDCLDNNMARATESISEFYALPCDVPLFNLHVIERFKTTRSLFEKNWKVEISSALENLKETNAGTMGWHLLMLVLDFGWTWQTVQNDHSGELWVCLFSYYSSAWSDDFFHHYQQQQMELDHQCHNKTGKTWPKSVVKYRQGERFSCL